MILVIGDFTDILIHQSVGGVIFLKKGVIFLPGRQAGGIIGASLGGYFNSFQISDELKNRGGQRL